MNEGKMDESKEGEGVLKGDTKITVPNTPETLTCRALASHPGPNVSWWLPPVALPTDIWWILKGPHSHRGFFVKVRSGRKDNTQRHSYLSGAFAIFAKPTTISFQIPLQSLVLLSQAYTNLLYSCNV